ncbi:MAG TPA: N-6 DNA methylase [Opitutaceae bacterium]|jgi:type I restriction-modification system DNA methylase subunit|nr:N-6 DNA methylase [Opitutaceae bacterium]
MKSETFLSNLKAIAPHHDRSTVFNAFVLLAACAFSAQTREAEYLDEAKRWTKEELTGFSHALGALIIDMEADPFTDVLGVVYTEYAQSKGTRERGGEFYTPPNVSRLMAQMLAGSYEGDSTEPITLCEPACGAGGMILAFAEALSPNARRRLRVTAIDISRTACHMAFINTTLWGIPARIHHANALSNEFWASWSNIHYLAPWLHPGACASVPDFPEQGAPASPIEVKAISAALGQQELGLD